MKMLKYVILLIAFSVSIIYISIGLWAITNIAFNHGTGYGISAVVLDIITISYVVRILKE